MSISNLKIARMALTKFKETSAEGKEPDNSKQLAWLVLKSGSEALKAKGFKASPQAEGLKEGYIRIQGKDGYVDITITVNKIRPYGIG